MIEHCVRRLLVAAMFGAALAAAAAPAAASPSLLFDLKTGNVLAHSDAFRRWHPASLTKLMTAYVAFRALDADELELDSPIKVTKNSAGEPPSKMGFKPGQVMSLDNALKMMLIKSANDVAMAVAENVGGSEKAFVARMNAEAARLGMTGSHFTNPNGLHAPDQYTTARDLGLLVMAIRKEYPQYAAYFAIEGLSAGKKVMRSYNLLVARRFGGADGMKTGFVCPSGFNMVGSATRGGRTLVAVVLGASTARGRAEFAAGLLTDGFAGTLKPGATLAALPVYGNPKAAPPNMREAICGKKKKKKVQSEASADDEQVLPLQLPPRPPALRLVAVGLGGATGPVPKAVREREETLDLADVPLPTPRPDYPPQAEIKAAAEGDTAAN